MTWIKTTDRLPEPGERVLVREGQSISICILEKYNKGLTFGEQVQCVIKNGKQKYYFVDSQGRPQFAYKFWLPLSVLPPLPENL